MYVQSSLCNQSWLLAQQQQSAFHAIQNMSSYSGLAGLSVLGSALKRERNYKDDMQDMEKELKSYLES